MYNIFFAQHCWREDNTQHSAQYAFTANITTYYTIRAKYMRISLPQCWFDTELGVLVLTTLPLLTVRRRLYYATLTHRLTHRREEGHILNKKLSQLKDSVRRRSLHRSRSLRVTD